MKEERKRKISATGLRNGTRPSLSHSKFCTNGTKDVDGFLYASVTRNTSAAFDEALSDENVFKMFETQRNLHCETRPNTSTAFDLISLTELKTTASSPIVKNMENASGQAATPTIESFQSSEKDEPVLKHHLEQVFITPVLNKRN